MNSFTGGLLTGLGVGGVLGFVAGVFTSKKAINELQKELDETSLYYEEEISKIEEQVEEINKRFGKKEKKEMNYFIDDEPVEVLEDCEFEDDVIVADVSPAKDHIHPMFHEEAMEYIDSHKAKLETVYLFDCGTLTEDDKETPITEANRIIGYDILNELSKISNDASTEESVNFVYNDSTGVVYEIVREYTTYKEYMSTV